MQEAILHISIQILEGNKHIIQPLQHNKVCACQIPVQVFHTIMSLIFQHLACLDISLAAVYCTIQNTVWPTVPCRQTVMQEEIDCIEKQIIHELKVVTLNCCVGSSEDRVR